MLAALQPVHGRLAVLESCIVRGRNFPERMHLGVWRGVSRSRYLRVCAYWIILQIRGRGLSCDALRDWLRVLPFERGETGAAAGAGRPNVRDQVMLVPMPTPPPPSASPRAGEPTGAAAIARPSGIIWHGLRCDRTI